MSVKTSQRLVRHLAKLAIYRDNAVLPAFLVLFVYFVVLYLGPYAVKMKTQLKADFRAV